jgi:hypothetical protein
MKRWIVALCIFLFPVLANAEIEKFSRICEKGICFYWWPKLASVKGWHQELESNYAISANVQVPNGFTFSNAETVIYAKALYKLRTPETKSLEMLIKDDKDTFISRDPGIVITEAEPLETKDGKLFKSYTFFPRSKGNWEQVCYGEESDFYLIFTISSRTQEGFNKTVDAFKQYIKQYEEKPK